MENDKLVSALHGQNYGNIFKENQTEEKGMTSKHEVLVDLIFDLLISQGLDAEKHYVYRRGELDILCKGIYYEVKCNLKSRNVKKALEQIERAKRAGVCDYGYLATYQGIVGLEDLKG